MFQKKLGNSLFIICGYFCIGFIDFRLKDKSLLEFKNLFSPNEYKTNDKVIKTFFAKRILKT